jgi:hypothetical protein
MKQWFKRGLFGAGGALTGLALAELAFSLLQGGAFPHLNIYVPDADLGTRLEPNASMTLRIADNPATLVRTNDRGYRGAPWPDARADELVVVGDSQAFGLGVAEEQTLSAYLAELTGRSVRNLGVPTYGPSEYRAVIEEVGKQRRPSQVVLVINMANDLFEVNRPNRERHAIWDGWAVRKETAPEKTFEFPGRSWLFQRSHAVFALRRYLASRDHNTELVTRSTLPSEASFASFVAESTRARAEHEASVRKTDQNQKAFREAQVVARGRLEEADTAAIARLVDLYGNDANAAVLRVPTRYEDEGWVDPVTRLKAARATPGDIVGEISYGESTGPYVATARAIRDAARFRASLEEVARRRQTLPHDAKAKDALAAIQKTAEAARELDALLATAPKRAVAWSPLKEELEKTQAVVEGWGGELVVVVLPLDVQVSEKEWAKYGGESVPMGESELVNQDAVSTAKALGLRVITPLEELRAAEPGAFLNRDLHLTAKGNRAVAEAIFAALRAPKPLPMPQGGLPPGRRRVPSPASLGVEAVVKGSSEAHCETFLRSGWFRAICVPHDGKILEGVLWEHRAGEEAHSYLLEGALSVVVPFAQGNDLHGTIVWRDEQRSLRLSWPAEAAEPTMEIGAPQKHSARSLHTVELRSDHEACLFAKKAYDERMVQETKVRRDNISNLVEPPRPFRCLDAVLTADSACENTYRGRPEPLLACLNGDPWFAPPCGAGFANGGAMERCLALCDETVPCSAGALCQPWQGAKLCFPNEGPM